VTNNNKSRTVAGIYLGVTDNIQGPKKVFDLKTGTVKKPRSITVLPIPDSFVKQVDAWGKKYQAEEKKNKLKFLNRKKLQYDWDNNELEEPEGATEELAHPDLSAEFSGIEQEVELEDGGTAAMTILKASTEQEAHDAAVNGELIEPITQAPSVAEVTATDVIIIDDDHDTDDIVAWQECITEIKQEPVETDMVNATIAEPDQVIEEPVIEGTIHNKLGHQRSA
jgi:hypothetical protein